MRQRRKARRTTLLKMVVAGRKIFRLFKDGPTRDWNFSMSTSRNLWNSAKKMPRTTTKWRNMPANWSGSSTKFLKAVRKSANGARNPATGQNQSGALPVLPMSKHKMTRLSHKILAFLRKIFLSLHCSSRFQVPVADYSVISFWLISHKILHPWQDIFGCFRDN